MTRSAQNWLLNQIGPIADAITWTTDGALDGYALGNGLQEERTYDNRRRLVAMSTTDSKGSVVRGLRYGLDAASRIVEIADLRTSPPAEEDLTASFQYDDRYRLTTATYRTGATTWQHDDLAKVTTIKSDFGDPHLNVTNSYGENGAGPDALTHHGTESLNYDSVGRVTSDGERTYEWDAKGRLSKVTRGKTVEEYVYGHDDARAIKRTTTDGKIEVTRYIEKDVEERDGALIRYAYLGDQRLARLDPVDVGPRTAPVTKTGESNGATIGSDNLGNLHFGSGVCARMAQVMFSPRGLTVLVALILATIALFSRIRIVLPVSALRLASVVTSLAVVGVGGLVVEACSPGGSLHAPSFREQSIEITTVPNAAEFYLADVQQSPLAVVSKAASVLSRIVLHPFGSVRFQTGKSGDPWGFVGNEEDRGPGISDFRARPYRPELGAFLAVDPVAVLTPEKLLEKPRALAAYLYAISDPINNSDADGMEPTKSFWTKVGQGAIHLVAETICMSLGGCGYANAPAPGARTYAQATPGEVALNLTAAHVAPRINRLIGSRILKGAGPLRAPSTVAAAAKFGENDLVLGLNPMGKLKQWASKMGGKTFGEFETPRGGFDVQIRSAMDQSKAIRFNLDGVNVSRMSGKLSTSGEPVAGYTNYELFVVKNTPRYLEKTSFYMDGKQVKSPF